MLNHLRKARALWTHAFAIETTYRAEIIIWMISGSLPLIMLFVWMSLAEAGPMGGYDAQDFAAYFLLVFLIRQLTVVWVVFELEREIRLGELSPKLLKPIDPFWVYVSHHLSAQTVRLPLVIPIFAVGIWLSGANLSFSLLNMFVFSLALAFAWTVRFNLLYSIGLLSFWTDQTIALNNLVFTVFTVLSGMLIPIDLFPEGLRGVINFTPFPYLIDFPVRVMLGRVEGAALLTGLAIQVFWIAVFVALRLTLWRNGLKRYGAVGA